MSLEHSPARQGGPKPAAYTVTEFCIAHRLSRSKLYQLWAAGIGPRWMYVGTKRLISHEAAADWRREREAAAVAEAAKAARVPAIAASSSQPVLMGGDHGPISAPEHKERGTEHKNEVEPVAS